MPLIFDKISDPPNLVNTLNQFLACSSAVASFVSTTNFPNFVKIREQNWDKIGVLFFKFEKNYQKITKKSRNNEK